MNEEFYTELFSDNKKKRVNYTIDEELLKEFDTLTKAKKLKKSRVIEKMIKVFVEQEKSLFK